MELQFNCIAEQGVPGLKFKALFESFWPDYKRWLESDKVKKLPDLETSVAALEQYMPEMLPLYHNICKAVNADALAAQFFTGFQPPPYLAACSQAVLRENTITLVRNYDYHPDLLEGTILLSGWNQKRVIATTDCLFGVLDGINDDGLSVSLTFGGRNIVGSGFGIPFILRYVLEFCSSVDSAVSALERIPCHMAYNVTVVDKTGDFKTVFLSPDRETTVTNQAYTTNHQEEVEWEENAVFNKTVKRSEFLEDSLADNLIMADEVIASFLRKPLYSHLFSSGFGTVYTAIYRPEHGSVEFHWPTKKITQSFDHFAEVSELVQFTDQPMDNQTVSALSKLKKKTLKQKSQMDKKPKNRRKKNLALRKVDLRMG